ncbi:MAG: YihY/virulence factor BrkB family protein [Alphaproteobacteria bacterium]|nr:YihY/virulence factor BrkB family protein [Alphaproteobacteria bacterium]
MWGTPESEPERVQTAAVHIARVVVVLTRDVASGQLILRAMSLVYTTLLSIVPLLALSFSLLKGLGVHNQLEPVLQRLLAPLGPEADAVTGHVMQFIENMHVGVLGSAGLALLLYTSVSLVQKIEESFNFIWHVSHSRSIGERFSRYLSVLLIGPLLVFSAIGISTAVMNSDVVGRITSIEPFGLVFYELSSVVPYLLVIAAFALVYLFIPNTRVRYFPALMGAVVGGILWQTAGWGFAQFVASSTRYAAIYSSFAVLILFLIWLYMSWLILLFGASVAFYVQHPEYVIRRSGEPRLSNRMRERVALILMSHIVARYRRAQAPLTAQELARPLRIPMHAIDPVLDALQEGGMLTQSNDDPPAYLPARDLSAVSVLELLDVVRRAGEDRYLTPAALPASAGVERALEQYQRSLKASLSTSSITTLIDDEPEGPPRP